MNGPIKLTMETLILDFLLQDQIVPRKCCTQLEDLILIKIKKFIICIEKLMEILHLESKKPENMNGNSILRSIVLVMLKKKFLTGLHQLYKLKDLKNNFRKLLLLKKLLKIIMLLHQIFLERARTQVKVKQTEDKISLTE